MLAIVHNEPVPSGYVYSQASVDVLAQVEVIERALENLGYPTVRISFTKDLGRFVQVVEEQKVTAAFNLCESVDEDARYLWHPAAVLELLGIPFSGSSSAALMLTTDKLLTKRLLNVQGITTPRYLPYNGIGCFEGRDLRYPVIVKPRFEDASIGIDQESLFEDEAKLQKGLRIFSERFAELIIEEYIDGREFNVSLFGYPTAQILPLAEIDFSTFPGELYRIVGYRAKWEATSFEYHHTPRRFCHDLPPKQAESITETALKCFELFMLRDYGRVDMRIDACGTVYVLEVNANPCLSPDAGFAAAIAMAGMTHSEMVQAFVDFMGQRQPYYGH